MCVWSHMRWSSEKAAKLHTNKCATILWTLTIHLPTHLINNIETENLQVLNPLDAVCDRQRNDAVCVSNLKNAKKPDKGVLVERPDVKIFLPFRFYFYRVEELFQANNYNRFLVAPGGDHLISLIDEISYVSPPAPMISQLHDIPPEQFCNGDNRPPDCGLNCMCTHTVDIPLNAIVEVVLVDEGETNTPNTECLNNITILSKLSTGYRSQCNKQTWVIRSICMAHRSTWLAWADRRTPMSRRSIWSMRSIWIVVVCCIDNSVSHHWKTQSRYRTTVMLSSGSVPIIQVCKPHASSFFFTNNPNIIIACVMQLQVSGSSIVTSNFTFSSEWIWSFILAHRPIYLQCRQTSPNADIICHQLHHHRN